MRFRNRLSRKRTAGSMDVEQSGDADGGGAGVIASSDASWRVENMRCGPPQTSDWWTANDKHKASFSSSSSSDNNAPSDIMDDDSQCEFHNCGLSTWEEARKRWRTPPPLDQEDSSCSSDTDKSIPFESRRRSPPPPLRRVHRDDVIRGLTRVSRTYELPQRVTLPDIVDLFVDIWDCEKDG